MPDLTLLIGIGYRTSFKLLHCRERTGHSRLQLVEIGGVDVHPADVEPDTEIVVKPTEITESLPLNLRVSGAEIREAHAGVQCIHAETIHNPPYCPIPGTPRLVSWHSF